MKSKWRQEAGGGQGGALILGFGVVYVSRSLLSVLWRRRPRGVEWPLAVTSNWLVVVTVYSARLFWLVSAVNMTDRRS